MVSFNVAFEPSTVFPSCTLYLQYFVSQCLGIGQVGYAMVCFGVCNVVNSVIAARVAEKFGRIVVVLTGAVIALTILQFLLHWSREPNKSLLFVIGGLWGIVDASFNQQLTGVCSLGLRVLVTLLFRFSILIWNFERINIHFSSTSKNFERKLDPYAEFKPSTVVPSKTGSHGGFG